MIVERLSTGPQRDSRDASLNVQTEEGKGIGDKKQNEPGERKGQRTLDAVRTIAVEHLTAARTPGTAARRQHNSLLQEITGVAGDKV